MKQIRDFKNVVQVSEETDLEHVNILLESGWMLIGKYTKTAYDGDNNETLVYSLGRLQPDDEEPVQS